MKVRQVRAYNIETDLKQRYRSTVQYVIRWPCKTCSKESLQARDVEIGYYRFELPIRVVPYGR